MEESNDESVQVWFEARLNAAPKYISERVRSSIDLFSYLQCKDDPFGAAMEFVFKFITALDNNNSSDVIHDAEKSKSLIKRLVPKLEPAELRV